MITPNTANLQTSLEQIYSLLRLHQYTDDTELYIQCYGDNKGKKHEPFPLRELASRYIELETYFNKGLNIGFRRNRSHKLAELQSWYSFLIEYDQGNLDDQLKQVKNICQEHNLPFPSAVVFTGGKSYHFYWCLTESVSIETGNQLQADLITLFVGCDSKFKSAVQVSRLPGFRHTKTGEYAQLTDLGTNKQYSYAYLRAATPEAKIQEQESKRNSRRQTKAIDATLLKQEYEVLKATYEVQPLTREGLAKGLNDAIRLIQNAKEGVNANNSIWEAGLIVGSRLLKGLNFDESINLLSTAINNKLFSNLKKSFDTLYRALSTGLANSTREAKIRNKSYQLNADIEIKRDFIGKLDWIENKQVLLIKSAIGTGKTTSIKAYIKHLPENAKVLVIAHRRALVMSLVNELNFESYDDEILRRYSNLSSVPNLVITIDSLHHLIPVQTGNFINKYDLVIIDEIDQALDHLNTAKTSVKKYRRQCLESFYCLVKLAKKVIGASATLTDLEVAAIAQIVGRNNICVVKNNTQPKAKRIIKFDAEEMILQELKKDVESGNKIFIACNSRRKVEALVKRLKSIFFHANIVGITSKNIKEEFELIDSLTSQDKPLNIDVLVCSPSLGTGFDISRSYFDITYGIFVKIDALSATDLLQAIGRVRYPKTNTVKAFVEPGILTKLDTNPEKHREALTCCIEFLTTLNIATGQIVLIKPEITEFHLFYASETLARKAVFTTNLSQSFWTLVNECGHKIITAEIDNSIVQDLKNGNIESEKQAVKNAKQKIKEEELIKIQDAPIIDELDIEKLDIKKKSVLGLNEEEQNSLNRYYFIKNTGLKPDINNLDWYENKGGKKVCRLIQIQQMPYDYAVAIDIYETEIIGKLHIDLSNNLGKKVILEDLKNIFDKSMRLFPTRDANKQDKGFYLDSLKDAGFIDYLKSSGDLIKALFNISPNLTEPVKTARTILSSLFGIDLETKEKQVNGERTRVYLPKAESTNLIEQITKNVAKENINFWINRCKDIQTYLYGSTKTSPKCKELYEKLSSILVQLTQAESNTHVTENQTGQDLANTHVS